MEEDNGVKGWGPDLRLDRHRSGSVGGCWWLCEEEVKVVMEKD